MKRRDIANAQVALAWLMRQPGGTAPIVGATRMSHLEELAGVVEIRLNAAELASLAECYRPHPVLGHS